MSGNGNGNGNGGTLGYVLRTLLGDMPKDWIRIALLTVGLTLLWVEARDIKAKVERIENSLPTKADKEAVRDQFRLVQEDRDRIVKKADSRIGRLYGKNGWEYQGIDE